MKAAIYTSYGAPDTVHLAEVPTPAPGPSEVLVRVHASTVTTADWRLRASAFPGLLWLPGRLMTGLLRPRNPGLGMEVAGEIVAIGAGVTRFHVGQRVFGFSRGGGHAEYVVFPETAALIETPPQLSDAEAASLPFGAISALEFLRDIARVTPGQHVLVVGASGGVGVYAVQIAKALGAEVTAVASGDKADLLRDVGADHVLDYRRDDITAGCGIYDLVFDTVGATRYPRMMRALKRRGLYLPLNFGGRELWHSLLAVLIRGPRIKIHVNGDSAEQLRDVLEMLSKGRLRPVIDRVFALEQIRAAHSYVEARHRRGAVVVKVASARNLRSAA